MKSKDLELTPTTTTSELPQIAHAIAVQKGWWDDGDRDKGELVNLVMSEWAEALEALREGEKKAVVKISSDTVFSTANEDEFKLFFKSSFKGKFITELGDIMIRLFDWMGRKDLYFRFDGNFPKHNYYYPNLDNCENCQQKMSLLRQEINGLEKTPTPELTDKITSILAICESLAEDEGCGLREYVLVKMRYNLTRPHKHGGKKF